MKKSKTQLRERGRKFIIFIRVKGAILHAQLPFAERAKLILRELYASTVGPMLYSTVCVCALFSSSLIYRVLDVLEIHYIRIYHYLIKLLPLAPDEPLYKSCHYMGPRTKVFFKRELK